MKREISYIKDNLYIKLQNLLNRRIVEIQGVRLQIPDEVSKQVRHWFYSGAYEKDELSALKEMVCANDRILECGTGIGLIAVYAAQILGDANVVTCDANPDSIQHAQKTFELNNSYPRIEHCLLGQNDGKQPFYSHRNFCSSSSIRRSEDDQVVSVPVKEANAFVRDIDPTLLVVDIEGGEADLFDHLDLRQTNIRAIVVEVHPDIVRHQRLAKTMKRVFEQDFYLDFDLSNIEVFVFRRNRESGPAKNKKGAQAIQ